MVTPIIPVIKTVINSHRLILLTVYVMQRLLEKEKTTIKSHYKLHVAQTAQNMQRLYRKGKVVVWDYLRDEILGIKWAVC